MFTLHKFIDSRQMEGISFSEETDIFGDAAALARKLQSLGGGIYDPCDFVIRDAHGTLIMTVYLDKDGQLFERSHDGTLLDND